MFVYVLKQFRDIHKVTVSLSLCILRRAWLISRVLQTQDFAYKPPSNKSRTWIKAAPKSWKIAHKPMLSYTTLRLSYLISIVFIKLRIVMTMSKLRVFVHCQRRKGRGIQGVGQRKGSESSAKTEIVSRFCWELQFEYHAGHGEFGKIFIFVQASLLFLFSLPLPSPLPPCSFFSSAHIPMSSLFLFLCCSHPQFFSVPFSLPLPSPISLCSLFPSAPIPNSSLFSFPFRSHPQFLSVPFSLPLPSPIFLCSLFSSAPIPNFSLFSFPFRSHPQFRSNFSLFPFLFRSHLQFLSVPPRLFSSAPSPILSILFSLLLPSKFLWDWMKVFLENLQCYW